MKLFSFPGFLMSAAITMAACCCEGSKSFSNVAYAAETKVESATVSERNYLVEGMSCGGCVYGVKKALDRAGVQKTQIVEVDYKTPEPDKKIGHAKLKFSKDQYKGLETDCKIIKEIRDNPGYIAYWDSANKNPCDLDKKL